MNFPQMRDNTMLINMKVFIMNQNIFKNYTNEIKKLTPEQVGNTLKTNKNYVYFNIHS